MAGTAIEVVNARTHNLKGVSCRVPHGRVTVITGPSGAGKSSLAFDTIYAEGQRRFVESMSTYTRQFLEQMERAEVDDLRNVQPAVAIEARNAVRNARATVGTMTEANDVMRLIFANLGEVVCPNGHGAARRGGAEEAARELAAGVLGERFDVLARLERPARGADTALGALIRQGFARRLAGGEGPAVRMEPGTRWDESWRPLVLVLGRFHASSDALARLAATLDEALRLGRGRCEAVSAGGARRFFATEPVCGECGESVRRPVPALFSFNSPLGACAQCQGFGRIVGIDPERVIPDPGKTLRQRPIAPWNTPAYADLYDEFYRACRRRRVPLDVPWNELSEEARRWVWSGKGRFVNLDGFFGWLEARLYRVHLRVLLARYRSYTRCPACGGARLRPEALAVRIAGLSFAELAGKSVEELAAWFRQRTWNGPAHELAGHLVAQLAQRLDVLERVGLGYLTLDRQARTLSGGEAQRIHLASALGSGLTSTLYVLDEPTVGLHPRDSARLLALLRDLAQRGNTVLVVEHDRTIVRGADHVIDLGPKAGEAGGRLVAEGTPAQVLADPSSLTARYLRDRPATEARGHLARFRREHAKSHAAGAVGDGALVSIRGARANNLRGFDVAFPLGALVAVTGVSGSGKSTLIENVLYANYQRRRGTVDVDPGECDGLDGLEGVADVMLVDQQPLGRSSRSNPVTYIKAYDEIRKLYAAAPGARSAGITAAHFSFNLERGRCAACEGTGIVEVDMQFMAPVTVRCDACQGRRFKSEVLAVRALGRTIAETLELTVDEALVEFADQKALCRKLASLREAGLGYLRLGQPTATLSGGEAQRLKLASFLDRPRREGPVLFLFDEPTTGLHASDVDLLYRTLRRLLDAGHGVVVVEHSLELISRCDWIVDLGPGGGDQGGELLFAGSVETFLKSAQGATAEELRGYTRWAG
jgi:excinuclease ABC subunit A